MSVIIGNQLVLEPVTLGLARVHADLQAELGVPIHPQWPNPEFHDMLHSDMPAELEFWAIIHVGDRQMIGEIGTKSPSHDPIQLSGTTVEIGYGIVPEYRGRGLASEAVRLLCDWLFSIATVRVITAKTDPKNLASAKVLLKNDFQPAGKSDEGRFVFTRR
ncbi:MAG: GNAT family N-acetyltransferase [Chthonomonas sp.]|nr:GNAT family N-acetyltransferase [Chthonomonas sp.]